MAMSVMTVGAWSATVDDLVAIDNDWTFFSDRYSANGTVGLERNTLYANGRIFTSKGSVATTGWKGEHTFNGVAHKNCLRVNNVQDHIAFKVTGPCKVVFYTESSADRLMVISKSERTNTSDEYYAIQPASTPIWEVELDEAGTYHLSNSGGDEYFAGFEVKYPVPAWQKIDIDLRSGQLGTEGTGLQKYLAIDGEENYTYSDVESGSYNAILSANSYNGSDHGYVGFKATVPVEAGIYKITLGTCNWGSEAYVKNSDESSTFNLVNVHGQTVSSLNQNNGTCYHQNTSLNVVYGWFTAASDEAINIVCGAYTPYFSIERVNNVPELKYLVIYQNETADVEGKVPSFEVLDEEDLIAIPVNRTLYKSDYTLTGWNDGSVTHAPGTSFAPTALTTTLTTVFEENLYDLNASLEDWTARWEFHRANGAPLMQWEGHSTPDLLVTQATLNGHAIDLPLHVTTSPGKFNNAANENVCQVNGGTVLTFPSISGATVKTYSNDEPKSNTDVKSTLDGNVYSNYDNHVTSYSTTNASGTSTLVVNGGRYYEYLEVTFPASEEALPLVKSVTVDGVEMGSGILAPLNFENPHSATFAGNIYTTVPVVQITYSDDAIETLVASGTGTTRTYTANKTISATDYTFTLNIEGVHVYEADANDEYIEIKNDAHRAGDVWKMDNYKLEGSLDGGQNGNFKLNGQSYSLSVPTYVIVKQVIIKNFANNYSGKGGLDHLISITSDGATAYVPVKNNCWHSEEKTPYDLIVNIDGYTAGKPLTITFSPRNGQPLGWIQLTIEKTPFTRTHKHMNLNTLCFPYQIDTYTGATFYTILKTEVEAGELTDLWLEEHQGALEAGKPYFYDPTPGSDALVCYFSGSYTAAQEVDGLQGSYPDDASVPAGAYVTYQNMIRKVGDNVTMGEYRAYIAPNPSPVAKTATPGRKLRRVINADAPQVTTGVETVNSEELIVKSLKVILDGQLFIIRDGKTYNAMGQMVK